MLGAFPTSMVIFSVMMIYLVQSKGWKALPLTMTAGFMYGWVPGGLLTVQPLTNYVVWAMIIGAGLYVSRPKVFLSWWLILYLFVAFLLQGNLGTLENEFLTEVLWVVAFWRTFGR